MAAERLAKAESSWTSLTDTRGRRAEQAVPDFDEIDHGDPERKGGDVCIWNGEDGSFLPRNDGDWVHLREIGVGTFVGSGDYDADALLGTLLTSLTRPPPKNAEDCDET